MFRTEAIMLVEKRIMKLNFLLNLSSMEIHENGTPSS